MSIEISSELVDKHIERTLELLKKQKFIPQAISLTYQERKQLDEFLFTHDEYGREKCIFGKYYYLKIEKDVEKLNQIAFENMNAEIQKIFLKCGVCPKRIFSFENGNCDLDRKLLSSFHSYSITHVGDFIIELTRKHPLDRQSAEIISFREEVQQEKYEKHKEGEATFKVFYNKNGERKQIYYHQEGMHFGGHINFMGYQIGGNFGLRGFRFSAFSGMMEKEEGRATCINELIPFFENFENLLMQEIMENTENLSRSRK